MRNKEFEDIYHMLDNVMAYLQGAMAAFNGEGYSSSVTTVLNTLNDEFSLMKHEIVALDRGTYIPPREESENEK